MKRIVMIAVLALSSQGVYADQNHPQLDNLFKTLALGEDVSVIDEIWRAWSMHDNFDAQAALDVGALAMRQRQWGKALTAINRAIAIEPSYSEAWNKRATLYYLQGELERSIADIKVTLKLEARHFGAMAGMAQILLQQKRPEAAHIWIEEALKINPFLKDLQRRIANELPIGEPI